MQVSTKLNRSHLVHGQRALILPCLGRTEKDIQRGGPQGTTVEDAMSMVHLSHGHEGARRRRTCARSPRSSPAWRRRPCPARRRRGRTTSTTTTASATRWREVLDGFEDFNERVRAAARLPHPAAGARARLPHAVGPRRVLARAAARRRAARRQARPRDDALARPVEHHDLLEQRPLPRREEPAHARLHEPRRHGGARPRGVRPRRHHEHRPRRQRAASVYGYRALALRHPARQRGRLHAGAERAAARSATSASRATSR